MLAGLLWSGCAAPKSTPQEIPVAPGRLPSQVKKNVAASAKTGALNQGPVATLFNVSLGRVASVNQELRFIVVDFSIGPAPDLGRRMNVYRAGQKVGEIKISGPSRNNNIAADLVAGEVRVGDEVRED